MRVIGSGPSWARIIGKAADAGKDGAPVAASAQAPVRITKY
jgi:hypothetical protein